MKRLAAAAVLLALAFLPRASADTALDPVQAELTRIHDMYRTITQYHVLLRGDSVTKEMVGSTLFDVERYVDDMESRYDTDKLFIKDEKALEEIKITVAKAHFQCALLHAKGVDLEASINQYERVVDLLGFDPSEWNLEIERTARPGRLPNAIEVSYELAQPKDLVADLREFWSAGLQTRFRVRSYTIEQRRAMRLTRIGGAMDPFSQAAFALANERFAERIGAGIEEFRLVLPPGHYRVDGKAAGIVPLEFALAANVAPDPVMLNPNTFSFEFVSEDNQCHPKITSNGLLVHELKNLPYGTYRLEPPAGCKRRIPEKITVEQNALMSLRTEPEKLDYAKPGTPIFLFVNTPPGSSYRLRM